MSQPETINTTVIERYFTLPSHGNGMVFDCSLFFRGELDEDRLQQAWVDTVADIPRMYWSLSGSGCQQVWKSCSFDPSKFRAEEIIGSDRDQWIQSIDVRRGVGGKMMTGRVGAPLSPPLSQAGPSQTEPPPADDQPSWQLRFFFHHAACDGVGGARLISQTFQRYQESSRSFAKRERPAEKPPVAPRRLIPDRRNVWATVRGHNARLNQHAVKELQCPQASAGKDQVRHSSIADLQTRSDHALVRFETDASSRIRQQLRQQKIPLNDFAVAMGIWAIAKVTVPHRTRYISIMNPVEMRTWAQRRSLENHIGFAFVRRRHDELESINHTVQSVHEQMSLVRSQGSASELASGMSMVERIPGALQWIERLGFFVPTMSVTCMTSLKMGKRLGFTTRDSSQAYFLGDLEVKGFELLAPLPSQAQMAVTLWDDGRSLAMTLRTPPPVRHAPSDKRDVSSSVGLAETVAHHWVDATATFLSELPLTLPSLTKDHRRFHDPALSLGSMKDPQVKPRLRGDVLKER